MRRLFVWPAMLVAMFSLNQPIQRVSAADQTGSIHLSGYVPTVVADGRAVRQNSVFGQQQLDIAVSLRINNLPGLQQQIAANGGRALPETVTTQYLPSASDEHRVIQWLQSRGLQITGTYPNHVLVDASGTITQIESALHVTINNYRGPVEGQQRAFYAPAGNPQIDASIAGYVGSIVGLDNLPRVRKATVNGRAHGTAPYYPQDFANAYDVGPLWNAGATGAGQHIGITMWETPPSDTTLHRFTATTGAVLRTHANGRLRIIPVDGGTTVAASPDSGEAAMDIEYSGGLAPGAIVDYYEVHTDSSGNPTNKALDDALNAAGSDANHNLQITNSWGECEPSSASDPFVASTETVLAANAATGHTYFFASGDSGSWCQTNTDGTGIDPYAQYPADSPYAVGVGGTTFSNNVSTGWPGETSWTYCSLVACGGSPLGSSGGYSAIFARPAWQVAAGLSGNARAFPDISADADPYTGADVCYGAMPACDTFGGTSLSSPLWAGMLADVNSYLAVHQKPAVGFLAPTLYALANGAPQNAPFHDIVSGTNGAYSAGPGWDAVTGLGTPDVWNLAQDIAGVTAPPPVTGTGELIINGGFEGSLSPWVGTSNGGRTLISTAQAHSGAMSADLCGAALCVDQISQSIAVPTVFSTAKLGYWYYSTTAKRRGTPCTDRLQAQLQTTTGATVAFLSQVCNTFPTNRWVRVVYNVGPRLAPHRGQSLQIVFRATAGSGAPTNFYIDDVSLLTQ